jgi:hypothetical protein
MVLGFLKQALPEFVFTQGGPSTDIGIWRAERALNQFEKIGAGGVSFRGLLTHHALVIRGEWYHLHKYEDGSLGLDRRPFSTRVDKVPKVCVGHLDKFFSEEEIENIGTLFSVLICTNNNSLLWL